MAKKAAFRQRKAPSRPSVKPDRFARVVRLLRYLAWAPRTRSLLLRWLQLDMRAFYRDLTLLRSVGIQIRLVGGRYVLSEPIDTVLPLLPFPDPKLTLGEAQELAQGKGAPSRRLAKELRNMLR